MMGLGVVKANEFDVAPEIRGHSQLLPGILDRDNRLEEPSGGDDHADDQTLGPDQYIQYVLFEWIR
jgi:hypothetical protein